MDDDSTGLKAWLDARFQAMHRRLEITDEHVRDVAHRLDKLEESLQILRSDIAFIKDWIRADRGK